LLVDLPLGELRTYRPDVPFLSYPRRAVEITDSEPYAELTEYCAVNPGRVDQAFSPSTVYAADNRFAGPKDVRVYRFNGHEHGATHHLLAELAFAASL
jgi:cephalosporin-C deacetylase